MRQFGRFLDSSLRVVRREVRVGRRGVAQAELLLLLLLLTAAHRDCAVVVHASGRRRVREVGQPEDRAPRAGHGVHVAYATAAATSTTTTASDVRRAALHVRPAVAAVALQRVRVIVGRGRVRAGEPLLGGRAI